MRKGEIMVDIKIQDYSKKIVVENGLLIDSNGLNTIYDLKKEYFKFVCITRF